MKDCDSLTRFNVEDIISELEFYRLRKSVLIRLTGHLRSNRFGLSYEGVTKCKRIFGRKWEVSVFFFWLPVVIIEEDIFRNSFIQFRGSLSNVKSFCNWLFRVGKLLTILHFEVWFSRFWTDLLGFPYTHHRSYVRPRISLILFLPAHVTEYEHSGPTRCVFLGCMFF